MNEHNANYVIPSGSRSRTSIAGLGYEFSNNFTQSQSDSAQNTSGDLGGAPKVEMMSESESNFLSNSFHSTPVNRGSLAFFKPANMSKPSRPLAPTVVGHKEQFQIERSLFDCDWDALNQGLPQVGFSRRFRWNGVHVPSSSPVYSVVKEAIKKSKMLGVNPRRTISGVMDEESKRLDNDAQSKDMEYLDQDATIHLFAADMDFDQSICIFYQSTPSKPAQPNKAPIKVKVAMTVFVSVLSAN